MTTSTSSSVLFKVKIRFSEPYELVVKDYKHVMCRGDAQSMLPRCLLDLVASDRVALVIFKALYGDDLFLLL